MNKKKLLFNISDNTVDAFLLAVSYSGRTADEVFEELAKEYISKTLSLINNDRKEENAYLVKTERLLKENDNENTSKVIKKIPQWARRPSQINTQIIRSFFMCEQNQVANRQEMKEVFLQLNPDRNYFQFENNLVSMGTDSGNSHGHVFDFYGDRVQMSDVAREILLNHKEFFLGEEIHVEKNQTNNENYEKKEERNLFRVLEDFKSYCRTPGIYSGKAQSYANAIQYLCDYLGVDYIDDEIVSRLRDLELKINSSLQGEYNKLLHFLVCRRQSSYLTNGFIRAALSYFYPFWREYNSKA